MERTILARAGSAEYPRVTRATPTQRGASNASMLRCCGPEAIISPGSHAALTKMRLSLCKLAVAALLSSACPARAAPVLETYGAWGNVTPFQARVLPGGMDATYFNPSLLIASRPGVKVGVMLIRESLRIDLRDRPPGADVSDAIFNARVANPDGSTSRLVRRPLPTQALRVARGSDSDTATRSYLTLGSSIHVIPGRLAVGFHMLLPTRSFQTQQSHYVDEREQYFSNSLHHELYGDRFETNVMSLAAAGELTEGVSLGIGVTLTNNGRASNDVFVPDASDQDVVATNTSVEVRTRFRPYAGIDVRLFEPWHVVATVHLPQANETDATNELQLWNFDYQPGRSAFLQTIDLR
ncbi:MAG: hypothetical protein MUF54_05615, partial [Polyangiaceae bacterium]|nr:hypothetical protein [Polyangiaceae bacterium]